MEKLETSYIAGGNVKWGKHFGKQFLRKLSVELPCDLAYSSSRYGPKRIGSVCLHKNVCTDNYSVCSKKCLFFDSFGGREILDLTQKDPQSWKRDLWSLLFSSWFHNQHTKCSLYLWDLKACRAIKRNHLLLCQKLPSEKPTGAHTDASWQDGEGKKVPEGGVVDSAVDLCPHCRVSFHPDSVSFWIRNPTFLDLPELCLL